MAIASERSKVVHSANGRDGVLGRRVDHHPGSPGIGRSGRPSESKTRWYDARELEVEGKGWTETKAFFDRLPARAEGVVRAPVWGLSRNSAGICIRFVTDATTHPGPMDAHHQPTGHAAHARHGRQRARSLREGG